MKPKLDKIEELGSIKEFTKETKDVVTRQVVNNLASISKDISQNSSEVTFIADEIRYKKRLEEEMGGMEKNKIVAGIDKLYEDNIRLQEKIKEHEKEYTIIYMQKAHLEKENKELEEKNKNLEAEIDLIKNSKNHGIDI